MNEAEGSPQASERKAPNMVGGNVANLVKRISTELQSKSEVPVRAGSNDVKQRRVKAAFSYTPQNEDELRLDVDDVIDVLGEEEEGWWKGKLKGRTGVFPANFVKLIETSPWSESRHESEERPKPDETGDAHSGGTSGVEIQPKKVAGIGFGNIFASNQKIELRNTKGSGPTPGGAPAASSGGDVMKKSAEGSSSVVTPPPKDAAPPTPKGSVMTTTNGKKPLPNPVSSSSSTADASTGHKHKDFAKALFAYDAENEDELSLQEGDIIVVVSKEVEDAGWWMGELNGKRGVFPDNFVAAISVEEAEKLLSEKLRKTTGGMVQPSIASAVGVPPIVPAKPPKPTPGAPSTLDSGKVNESKYDSPVQRQNTLPKSSDSTKSESHALEKAASATLADKDKPNIFRKPMVPGVPLIGMAKPKPFNQPGRFGSGANSPNSDEKADVDGESDGANAADADKLNHPTASRARNPNRRPPSQAFLKDMAVEPSLTSSTIATGADESLVLPKKPSDSAASSFEMVNNNGKLRSDSAGDEYVRREEFDKLQAAFESYKRETRERIRELERSIATLQAAAASKSQKL